MHKNFKECEFILGHLVTGGKLYFHEHLQNKSSKNSIPTEMGKKVLQPPPLVGCLKLSLDHRIRFCCHFWMVWKQTFKKTSNADPYSMTQDLTLDNPQGGGFGELFFPFQWGWETQKMLELFFFKYSWKYNLPLVPKWPKFY